MNMLSKNKSKIIVVATAVWFAGMSGSSFAQTKKFSCDFVSQHSSAEVAMALSYAKSVVSQSEAERLYAQYMSLKNECRVNPSAQRSVNISNEMISLVTSR